MGATGGGSGTCGEGNDAELQGGKRQFRPESRMFNSGLCFFWVMESYTTLESLGALRAWIRAIMVFCAYSYMCRIGPLIQYELLKTCFLFAKEFMISVGMHAGCRPTLLTQPILAWLDPSDSQ